MPAFDCPKCGKTHPRGCQGHRSGAPDEPCTKYPIRGGTHCDTHGGRAPQVKAAAARRAEAARLEKAAADLLVEAYGDDVPKVDPTEAILRAVSWKHAEVLALRRMVADLEERERVWGVTKDVQGGKDSGTTFEAKTNIWWAKLGEAERALVDFAAKAIAAGVEERKVRLAEQQGDLVSIALRRILDGLLEALVVAGLTPAMRAVWDEQVPVIVPRELRRVGGGEGS
ncbi:hypothetical protein DNL40_02455 [Xylanimonas oleitrophica]|uniref:Uncharacterized protein n=1 Tax=Xylanimonas oleitrophica TaxID=2607479 RepID=A0A2W5WX70_9MICO|nr:hypothetical protein [Xylanimonas oleitrophica]PZR55252.1 hypothetical protein DNL40_02455 [Xylanimonas oleitrophica]